MQDLEKQFKTSGRNILIADRLNMVIKNKQITVLLGHNGAGKTTTINMIMGKCISGLIFTLIDIRMCLLRI